MLRQYWFFRYLDRFTNLYEEIAIFKSVFLIWKELFHFFSIHNSFNLWSLCQGWYSFWATRSGIVSAAAALIDVINQSMVAVKVVGVVYLTLGVGCRSQLQESINSYTLFWLHRQKNSTRPVNIVRDKTNYVRGVYLAISTVRCRSWVMVFIIYHLYLAIEVLLGLHVRVPIQPTRCQIILKLY